MLLTYFLAQLIGVFFIIVGLSVLSRKKLFVAILKDIESSQGVTYLLGCFSLIIGLFIVLIHDVWSDGMLAIIVTLVGWILTLKGAFALFAPRAFIVRITRILRIEEYYWAYGIVVIVLGAYLTYSGFVG